MMRRYKNLKLRSKLANILIIVELLFIIPYIIAFAVVLTHLGDSAALISMLKTLLPVMLVLLVLSCGVATFLFMRFSQRILGSVTKISSALQEMTSGKLEIHVDSDSADELGTVAKDINCLSQNLKSAIHENIFLLDALAKGDFTVQSRIEWPGDWARMNSAFQEIFDSMNQRFFKIRDAADQTTAGSEQVASAAQALAQGATEQASSIQELSATITEVSEHVKSNAANATDADSASSTTKDKINEADKNMKDMMQAMSDISSASKKISNIIKTIDDIAFQTNILALNAAVEAARAGTAGKGFAVVADEVRNLASKSAEAAKDTAALIEDSIKAVDNGSRIAGLTENTLMEVMKFSGTANSLINEIANATNMQATSISQINQGVQQISTVVQTNSATAEQSAAASEELAAQAKDLKRSLSDITLREKGAVKKAGTDKEAQAPKKSSSKTPSNAFSGKKAAVMASSSSSDDKYL